MGRPKGIIVEGEIVEVLSNTMFKVKVQDRIVLAHLSGKMRLNYSKLLPKQKVLVELSAYDINRGRILEKIK